MNEITIDVAVSAEQQFKVILDSAPDAIVIVDAAGRIVIVNGVAERMFGYGRDELVGKPIEVLVPERLRRDHVAKRDGYINDPKKRPMGAALDLVAVSKDGVEFPVEISLSPVETDNGLLVTSVIRDTTDRKRLEQAERDRIEAQMQLEAERRLAQTRREVLRRAITAQEDERRRIARELHDETGQALTGVILGLGRIRTAKDLEVAGREAERLRESVISALKELRSLATRLRPTALDDLGLLSALERLVDEAPVGDGTEVSFHHHGLAERLEPAQETAIYRVVQEALTNAAKYSRADEISVDVERRGAALTACIKDDGIGFELQSVGDSSLGLAGMRERAELVGGSLDIDSGPGSGTTVTLRILLGQGQ